MDSRYRVSLEKQLEWLRWSEGPASHDMWGTLKRDDKRRDHFDRVRSEEQSVYEEILTRGTLFHVDEHFCQLVDYARRDYPTETKFDQTWLLAPYGFVWLDEPFAMPKIRAQSDGTYVNNGALGPEGTAPNDFRLAGRAIGWAPVDEGTNVSTAGPDGKRHVFTAGPGVYQFAIFQEGVAARIRDNEGRPTHLLPHPAGSGGFWPLSYFYLGHGTSLADRLMAIEAVARIQEAEAAYLPQPGEIWRHEVQYVYTLLQLMSQRVAAVRTERPDRVARRGFERRGAPAPEHFKVVKLRREYDAERREPVEAGSSGRVYRRQWWVGWFWRKFPYYATCDQCVARRRGCGNHEAIMILPFAKGPPGAPFIDGDSRRVFIADR